MWRALIPPNRTFSIFRMSPHDSVITDSCRRKNIFTNSTESARGSFSILFIIKNSAVVFLLLFYYNVVLCSSFACRISGPLLLSHKPNMNTILGGFIRGHKVNVLLIQITIKVECIFADMCSRVVRGWRRRISHFGKSISRYGDSFCPRNLDKQLARGKIPPWEKERNMFLSRKWLPHKVKCWWLDKKIWKYTSPFSPRINVIFWVAHTN